jgi:hypothetical protein
VRPGPRPGAASGLAFQLATRVGPVDDPLEREADAAATSAAVEDGQPQVSTPAAPPAVQRKCATCERAAAEGRVEPCPECAADVQRRALPGAVAASERHAADPSAAGHAGSAGPSGLDAMLGGLDGRGAPLDPQLRDDLGGRLGADFGGVRVHTGPSAADATRSLDAHAFTHRNHVVFAPGQYAPEGRAGRHLLAHELAHVVQQGAAPARSGAAAGPPGVQRRARPTVQRKGIGEGLKQLWNENVPSVTDLVAKVSPGLAEILREGPLTWITRKIKTAIEDGVGELIEATGLGEKLEAIKGGLGKAFDILTKLRKGGADSCKAFADILDGLRAFGQAVADSKAVKMIGAAFEFVSGIVGKVVRFVGTNAIEPLFGLLGKAGGVIVKLWTTVAGWVSTARKALGSAWDAVAGALGFGGGGEGGIMASLKELAGKAWTAIKATFAPIVGPLKTVATVVLMLSPVGPLLLLVTKGPELVQAVQWLWAHRSDPDIVKKSHKEMGNTFLPGLLDTAASTKGVVSTAVEWFVGKLTALATGALKLLGSITGIPLLRLAKGFVQSIADGVKALVAWAGDKLDAGAKAIGDVVKKIVKALAPYKEVLTSIAVAIAMPPAIPILLAGWAWKLIPQCWKRPIIDFLLDIVIAALAALPGLVMFGPLWALLKPGIIAFLRGLRKQSDAVKEAVADRIAKIMSGSSLDFLLGFAKGFLEGVWEGLMDPVKAIAAVIDGLNWVKDYFSGLAARAQGLPPPEPTPKLSKMLFEEEHHATNVGGEGAEGADAAGGAGGGSAPAAPTAGTAPAAAGKEPPPQAKGEGAGEAAPAAAGAPAAPAAAAAPAAPAAAAAPGFAAAAEAAGDGAGTTTLTKLPTHAAGAPTAGTSHGASANGTSAAGTSAGPSAAGTSTAGTSAAGSAAGHPAAGATAAADATIADKTAAPPPPEPATPPAPAATAAEAPAEAPSGAATGGAAHGGPAGAAGAAAHGEPAGAATPPAGAGGAGAAKQAAAAAAPATPAAGGAGKGKPATGGDMPAAPEGPGSAPPAGAEKAQPELGEMVSGMASQVQPEIATATGGFWPAVKEYFSGGKGVSFDELVDKLGSAWASVKAKIASLGGELADKVGAFFMKPGAEGEIGHGIGWLSGTVSFQLLLDALTVGSWKGFSSTLTTIANLINWPMEVMGQAFKVISKLGKYLVEAVKGLGTMAKKAAGGALKAVVEALSSLGGKLLNFGEQLFAKFGGKVAGKGAGVAEREAGKLVTNQAEKLGGHEVAKLAEEQAVGQVGKGAARVEGDAAKELAVAEKQTVAEVEQGVVATHPTPDGHSIKVTRSGRIVKCSTCEDILLRLESDYEHVFARHDDLERLFFQVREYAKDAAHADEAARLAMELEREVKRVSAVEGDLAEAGKLASAEVEGADKIAETTRARTSRHSPEAVLEADLERSGLPRPDEFHEPHHLVPKRSMGGSAIEDIPSAERAREILRTEGININEAANGVWLPRTSEGVTTAAASRHATIHTKAYYDEVARRLEEGLEQGDVRGALAEIQRLIHGGEFPH